ncbi:hypothetical protein GQ54DRAFT_311381 [Martensiomyces pterosporus]|nr:hypothetical protein GQ54DRAFT_311381 [Martensiomyces pterosporus]
MPPSAQPATGSLAGSSSNGAGKEASIEVFLTPPQAERLVAPGPDCTLKGHVLVTAKSNDAIGRVEVQFRGVEVVGGTMDDFDDELEELQPRKGARALNKVYFDERLVVWDRQEDSSPPPPSTSNGWDDDEGWEKKLTFAIALPRANYPAEIKSVCSAAPTQSFEISYQVIGWAVGLDGTSVVARFALDVPFVPLLTKSPASATAQPAVSRVAYDDRGKECLVTRVTLAQPDYVPGDQVVGGVYIECTKANRTIRKAECQLRQRVECRMRRTFSSAETAEMSAGSRPQSSQKSPVDSNDDSDILWTRVVELGPWQQLTLTSTGVGLAAAAASAQPASSSAGSVSNGNGGSPVAVAGNSDEASQHNVQIGDQAGEGSEGSTKWDGVARSVAIISGSRSYSANIHTNIPLTALMVPGHFLSFSYELLIGVTVSSLARGSQRVTTRTPLGSAIELTTPTSTSGQTLSRQQQPSLGEGHEDDGLAAEQQDRSRLKGNRFSVGAFQEKSDIASRDDTPTRYSTFKSSKSAPIRGGESTTAASLAADMKVNTSADYELGPLPNAVEQLRYRYDAILPLTPKIFMPAHQSLDVTVDSSSSAGNGDGRPNVAGDAPTSENAGGRASTASATTVPLAAVAAVAAEPSTDNLPRASASSSLASPDSAAPSGTAATPMGDNSNRRSDNDGSGNGGGNGGGGAGDASTNSSEYDLARAVFSAAEKVLNDKEWERPISYLPSPNRISSTRTSRNVRGSGLTCTRDDSGNSSDDNDVRQMFDALSNNSANDIGMDELDVEDAINELAPAAKQQQPRTSSMEEDGSAGIKMFVQEMDFFDSESGGPELTGMLGVNPDDLVASGADVTAYTTSSLVDGESATVSAGANGWGRPNTRVNSVLRRSISMPGGGSSSTAATAADSALYSPESTAVAARSAYESGTGTKSLFSRNNQMIAASDPTSQLASMSPRSVISAVSSASRLGSTSRVGVFKAIGHRFTSWFNKK